MSGIVEQMEALMKGATMDDLQALIEDNMERLRETLPALREQRAQMEGAEAEKMDQAIAGVEGVLVQYDEMRRKAAEEQGVRWDAP